MDRPLVSVITPAYNRKWLVLTAIESVLRQTAGRIEHIIVDDGSTDGTGQVIERVYAGALADGRLRYHRQPNRGPGAARNTALELARGDFVTYLDSDDLFSSNHVAALLTPFQMDGSGVGVTYAGFIEEWRDARDQVTRRNVEPLREFHPVEIRMKSRIPIMVMHRRELVDRIGLFDTDRLGLEDWDFLVRLSEVTLFRWVPAITALWIHREAEPSLTASLSGRQRDLKYMKVLKGAIRRELDGKIQVDELLEGLRIFNEALLGPVVAAAAGRPAADGRTEVVDISFQRIRQGELDSLLELIKSRFLTSHLGVQIRMAFDNTETVAIEWISKLNQMLAARGQIPILIQTP